MGERANITEGLQDALSAHLRREERSRAIEHRIRIYRGVGKLLHLLNNDLSAAISEVRPSLNAPSHEDFELYHSNSGAQAYVLGIGPWGNSKFHIILEASTSVRLLTESKDEDVPSIAALPIARMALESSLILDYVLSAPSAKDRVTRFVAMTWADVAAQRQMVDCFGRMSGAYPPGGAGQIDSQVSEMTELLGMRATLDKRHRPVKIEHANWQTSSPIALNVTERSKKQRYRDVEFLWRLTSGAVHATQWLAGHELEGVRKGHGPGAQILTAGDAIVRSIQIGAGSLLRYWGQDSSSLISRLGARGDQMTRLLDRAFQDGVWGPLEFRRAAANYAAGSKSSS